MVTTYSEQPLPKVIFRRIMKSFYRFCSNQQSYCTNRIGVYSLTIMGPNKQSQHLGTIAANRLAKNGLNIIGNDLTILKRDHHRPIAPKVFVKN